MENIKENLQKDLIRFKEEKKSLYASLIEITLNEIQHFEEQYHIICDDNKIKIFLNRKIDNYNMIIEANRIKQYKSETIRQLIDKKYNDMINLLKKYVSDKIDPEIIKESIKKELVELNLFPFKSNREQIISALQDSNDFSQIPNEDLIDCIDSILI